MYSCFVLIKEHIVLTHAKLVATSTSSYVYIYIFIHIYLYTYIYMYTYVYMYTHIYIYIHVYTCIFVYTCIYMCTCIYLVCIYTYIYEYIYVYIHIPIPPQDSAEPTSTSLQVVCATARNLNTFVYLCQSCQRYDMATRAPSLDSSVFFCKRAPHK